MSPENVSTAALVVSVVMAFALLIEKIFGGGSKFANEFHSLDKKLTTDMTTLRSEMMSRIDNHHDNSRVGFESIQANIHSMNLALLEQRAVTAEQFIRRDDFYKAFDNLKRDFKDDIQNVKKDMDDGFSRLTQQLDNMTQAIEAGRKAQKGT